MNHRTLLLTLFVAGALSTAAAFAQDATVNQQTPPVSTQADASVQQTTDADASATSGDASAATSEQVQTSGDASGMATNASTTSSYDSSATSDQDKKDDQN